MFIYYCPLIIKMNQNTNDVFNTPLKGKINNVNVTISHQKSKSYGMYSDIYNCNDNNYLSNSQKILDKKHKKIPIADNQFCLNGVLCERNCDNDIISFDDKEYEWVIFNFCKYNNIKFEGQKSYSIKKMKNMLRT